MRTTVARRPIVGPQSFARALGEATPVCPSATLPRAAATPATTLKSGGDTETAGVADWLVQSVSFIGMVMTWYGRFHGTSSMSGTKDTPMPSARARCTLRLAGRTGQVLDLSKASDGLAVDRTTIEQYVRLLEDRFWRNGCRPGARRSARAPPRRRRSTSWTPAWPPDSSESPRRSSRPLTRRRSPSSGIR
jgi:hypothetical protein